MGIKGLAKLIADNASSALSEHEIKNYFGRKIAIDASMSLYQFLIAVRADGPGGYGQLANDSGEVTSHISGMFYRTIRLLEHGIKPVYVFDGKPPVLKSHELDKRKKKMAENKEELEKARESGDAEEIDKYERRTVRVTKDQCEDVKKLLRLMGVPVVDAPSEAEAQCAQMCKDGLVYGTATEDMDALTFGTPRLIRHLMQSAQRKDPIVEYDLTAALTELGLDMDQFRDICILCGCDYTNSIRGIGQHRAFQLIKKYKTIDKLVDNLDKKKYIVPEDFLFAEARKLFAEPEVLKKEDVESVLQWSAPSEDELISYMVEDKEFNLERIQSGIARIKKSRGKGTQMRLESFFGPVTKVKRKKPAPKNSKKTKKAKKKR